MNVINPQGKAGVSDEHALVIPAAWRRRIHPRRGGLKADPPPPPAGDPFPESPSGRRTVAERLAAGETAPELAERVLAHVHGVPDPLGAAVLAKATIVGVSKNLVADLADGWATAYGPAFAACALVEMLPLIRVPHAGPLRQVRYAHAADASIRDARRRWATRWACRRLRARLAVADDGEYREAVERLARRRGTPAQRAVVSYLAPTRQDWVDELCASGDDIDDHWWAVLCALGSPRQLDLLGGRVALHADADIVGIVATLLEGVGAAAVPLITRAFDEDPAVVARSCRGGGPCCELADVLARLPGDAPFRTLLNHLDHRCANLGLRAAMKRDPARALRLLPAAVQGGSPNAAEASRLLAAHLAANERVVDATLPELPPHTRTIIEEIRAGAGRLPDAPAEALPPVLVSPPWTRKRGRADGAAGTAEVSPVRVPVTPAWADVALLPQVTLRDGTHALPAAAAGHLLTMLALSEPGRVHAGIGAVREACDPASLARFSRALYDQWETHGTRPAKKWIVHQLGWLGDDETVRWITPRIPAWWDAGLRNPAIRALGALAAIGTDTALRNLQEIARRSTSTPLGGEARRMLSEAAARRGLTPEQLADLTTSGAHAD